MKSAYKSEMNKEMLDLLRRMYKWYFYVQNEKSVYDWLVNYLMTLKNMKAVQSIQRR